MNHLNEINDNINELIMSKSFDRLSEEEKAKALEYAGSEEEYNNLRKTLLAIASSFSEETEEDFAGDEVKTDLMSQFEKKYGTSANRTKVIPLYRKTYFQLAIAASLALLVFFSIPMFKPKADQQNKDLAKIEMQGGDVKPEAGENKIPAESGAVSDAAAGKTTENPKREGKKINDGSVPNKSIVTEETKELAPAPPALNQEITKTSEEKNTFAFEKAALDRSQDIATKDKEQTVDALSRLEEKREKGKEEKPELQKNDATGETLSKSYGTLKDKDKTTAYYVSPHTDHTHDADGFLNSVATSGSTGPSRTNLNLVGFVEENKTEMLDLLFTVY